ncbi:hypothetical protein QBC47DRAFT_302419 [Echria macrotheca]|uniref:Zn(2)-C6 fungal-type domain-containing protein n=1 Tax=Echria macrotheca TaxID=438768 RepID=A0AAJ0BDS0_9PEZI|nr:hypothetical protein QBC47DRAFT_302419 [Echria macrotheca]
MDLLETQASEIRSFLGPGPPNSSVSATDSHRTVAAPPTDSASRSAPGDNSAYVANHHLASPNGTTTSSKRRADDDADDASAKQQQRSKRNRYISIACNECKRRKIKCNGQTPCQRCGHLNLQCLYAPNCCSSSFKDSDEFRQVTDQVTRLQDQVNELLESMNALRQETLRLAPIAVPPSSAAPSPSASIPSLSRSLPPFRVPPSFHGPTSIAYTVDVAKNTLHNMGYSGGGEGVDDHVLPLGTTPQLSPHPQAPSQSPVTGPPDPLWEFGKDEMIRLCRVHEEEVGIMYPVVSIDSIIEHAKTLAVFMESARRNGLVPPHGQDYGIADPKTLMLKIIMCCALVVEEHGNSAKAVRLYESMQPIVDKTLMSDPADVVRLPFLALCAGYRFLSNDEILAWRMMGHVARLCFELGLHRREGLDMIADPVERKNALNTFWSAYMLDRRWSFSTGLPFVCHDDKIDPKLPYPENHPYLVAMITYSKLGAEIWKLVDYFEPAVVRELKYHDFEVLDRQIGDWYNSIPDEIKAGSMEETLLPLSSVAKPYDTQRLRIWTRLRLNQIRIWLYTPVLHSAISIEENRPLAQIVVDLAKETIRFLARLNNETNLYRRIQVFYHQFLTSAIAVLFLASTHAPLLFSGSCRVEFYMALELIKDMSARSWVSQRLWRTVQSLKAYAPRLGLEEEERHPGGPVGLASLLRNSESPGSVVFTSRPESRPVRQTTVSTPVAPVQTEDPGNGVRLQSEMQRVFEGYMQGEMGRMVGEERFVNLVVPDGVYQHMKDMF